MWNKECYTVGYSGSKTAEILKQISGVASGKFAPLN
jgi:hypothetical protein